jgi:hypothetical protein
MTMDIVSKNSNKEKFCMFSVSDDNEGDDNEDNSSIDTGVATVPASNARKVLVS